MRRSTVRFCQAALDLFERVNSSFVLHARLFYIIYKLFCISRMREWRNGRRAGFRFLCLTTCGFKSHLAHEILIILLRLFRCAYFVALISLRLFLCAYFFALISLRLFRCAYSVALIRLFRNKQRLQFRQKRTQSMPTVRNSVLFFFS